MSKREWVSITGHRCRLPEVGGTVVRTQIGIALEVTGHLRPLWDVVSGLTQKLRQGSRLDIAVQDGMAKDALLRLHGSVRSDEADLKDACTALAERVGRLPAREARRWPDILAELANFRASLRTHFRLRSATAPNAGERDLWLEGMLRESVLNHTDFAVGPLLHPLILWSFRRSAKFCHAHRVDQGQLHRVLRGHGSISMGRLQAILDRFRGHPNDPGEDEGPHAYELRFVHASILAEELTSPPFEDWKYFTHRAVAPDSLMNSSPAQTCVTSGAPTDSPPDWPKAGITLEKFCSLAYAGFRKRRDVGHYDPEGLPYDRSYVLRVLRRDLPGSFGLFARLAYPQSVIVPKRLPPPGPNRDPDAEDSITHQDAVGF